MICLITGHSYTPVHPWNLIISHCLQIISDIGVSNFRCSFTYPKREITGIYLPNPVCTQRKPTLRAASLVIVWVEYPYCFVCELHILFLKIMLILEILYFRKLYRNILIHTDLTQKSIFWMTCIFTYLHDESRGSLVCMVFIFIL